MGEAFVSIADYGVTGGDPRHDDGPGVQAAINDAIARGISGVYCPPGAIYNLYSTVRIAADHVELFSGQQQGYGGPNARFDAQVKGLTMFDVSGAHNVLLRGLNLNGTNAAGIVLRIGQSASVTIERCALYNVLDDIDPATGQMPALIRGGGNQQLWIRDCRFNSWGRAIDLLNQFADDPHQSYYGANVFAIERCAISAAGGVRITGIGKIDCCAIEARVNGAAAVEVAGGPTDGNSYVQIVNNSFDLQAGNGPMVGIRVNSAALVATGNTMYGDGLAPPQSVGIDAKFTYGALIAGNSIMRWETGIYTSESYASNVACLANTFKECATDIRYPSRHYMGGPGNQANPDFAGFLIHLPGVGHAIGGTVNCVPAECHNTGNVLNLTKARFYEFTNATPTRVDTVTGPTPGSDFFLTARDPNTMLAGGVFGLAADFLLPVNIWVHFAVGSDRVVRPIGMLQRSP